jgi:hypothetical protein
MDHLFYFVVFTAWLFVLIKIVYDNMKIKKATNKDSRSLKLQLQLA